MTLVWRPGYLEGDRYYSNVSLLLHGNGVNGSTSIVDSSPSPKAVTAVGNAQISTAQSKWGGASIALDGSGDYLSLNPELEELRLGYGDCTLEAWIRMTAIPTQVGETYWPIIHRGAVFNTTTGNVQAYSFRYSVTDGNRLAFVHRSSSAGFAEGVHMFTKRSTVLNLSLNTWYYVKAVRQGNSLILVLDGVDVTDTSFGNYAWGGFDFSLTGANNKFEIGRMRGAAGNDGSVFWDANGHIDDLRITKGVARDVSIVPTAPFPDQQY